MEPYKAHRVYSIGGILCFGAVRERTKEIVYLPIEDGQE
jgi:hypothetical protein